MPELCERRFSNFEVVRPDEVSLDFLPLVRGFEISSLGVGKEGYVRKKPMSVL